MGIPSVSAFSIVCLPIPGGGSRLTSRFQRSTLGPLNRSSLATPGFPRLGSFVGTAMVSIAVGSVTAALGIFILGLLDGGWSRALESMVVVPYSTSIVAGAFVLLVLPISVFGRGWFFRIRRSSLAMTSFIAGLVLMLLVFQKTKWVNAFSAQIAYALIAGSAALTSVGTFRHRANRVAR